MTWPRRPASRPSAAPGRCGSYIVMAYIIMVHIVMAGSRPSAAPGRCESYTVMAYIIMVHIVMAGWRRSAALGRCGSTTSQRCPSTSDICRYCHNCLRRFVWPTHHCNILATEMPGCIVTVYHYDFFYDAADARALRNLVAAAFHRVPLARPSFSMKGLGQSVLLNQ